ncbi:Uncharacterised protein [Yersinia aldovae]|uniref:Uncharacterized protein n=1 Tax=Yersinia aldovae TaxID=29483 RepID=A0A0T9T0S9_YERAL|nr:hypothetical protein [Yersinia aldovae]CNK54764.1 Uncharacterised protein [Yersinia aldovae]CNK57826.1 Uncharacterised protein [Yersinia aldovae]
MKTLSIHETKSVSGGYSEMQSSYALNASAGKVPWSSVSPVTAEIMSVNAYYAKSIFNPDITISTDSHNVLATSETRIVINNSLPRG